MFEPKTPEEIREIVYAVVKRTAKTAGYKPELFRSVAESLIEEAVEWQKQNPTKSAWGNYRVDQFARFRTQEAIRHQRKADIEAK